jgi:hypothetical protein
VAQDLGNVAGRQVGALPVPLGDELIAHFPISMFCLQPIPFRSEPSAVIAGPKKVRYFF